MEQAPEFEMGGGGLYGTVRDYLLFCRMILNQGRAGGEAVLKPETVAEMAHDQIAGLPMTPLVTALPSASNDAAFFPGLRQGWGLTWLINHEATPEGRSPGSLAWAGLANTYYWIDPARGIAGVFATQILPFFDAPAIGLFRAFEREAYRALG
jgi:CubicO group peptidase (beta-lactamase class C family)